MTEADRQREIRRARLAAGLCTRCAGTPRPNRTTCQTCADIAKASVYEKRGTIRSIAQLAPRKHADILAFAVAVRSGPGCRSGVRVDENGDSHAFGTTGNTERAAYGYTKEDAVNLWRAIAKPSARPRGGKPVPTQRELDVHEGFLCEALAAIDAAELPAMLKDEEYADSLVF